jgi:hypothetical protein
MSGQAVHGPWAIARFMRRLVSRRAVHEPATTGLLPAKSVVSTASDAVQGERIVKQRLYKSLVGLVIGAVLGFAGQTLAASYSVVPSRARCTSAGGTVYWGTTYVRNITAGSDSTVTCTDLGASLSPYIAPRSVTGLDVYVIDRGTTARVKAQVSYTNSAGGTYASAVVYTPKAATTAQRLYFSSPWLYAASNAQVKITLPKNNSTTGSEVRPFTLQAP